jgi:hypothetical protein
MSDAPELGAEDAKLVALARAARARNAAAEGAAVRDDTGRSYVATTVDLPSLRLSALQAAVVVAVGSGAGGLEAAAVVSPDPQVRAADLAAVADLTRGAVVVLAGLDGGVQQVVTADRGE